MADRLILSLQPPPFQIFSSSLHCRWGLSQRFPGGIRGQLSSQLQLANSTLPSQSSSSSSSSPPPDSTPEKLDLVYSTQLKDGSHVFRFGDASEIERYLETEEKARCFELEKKQEHAKIAEEVSEVLRRQGVKDGHTLIDLDRVSELENLKEKSDVKKKPVKSNIEAVSEKEERAGPASLSNVIKIKDRKRVRSPVKKKKETPSSVDLLRSDDEVEAKVASVSNLSSIVSVAEAIPTSSAEPINENVEPLSSEVTEKVSVNEIRDCETNGYHQLTENRVEVQAIPRSFTSQHISELNDLKEVADVSTIELDDNLDERENLMKTLEAEENLVVEPTATVAVSLNQQLQLNDLKEVVQASTIELDDSLYERENQMKTLEAEENLAVEPTATVVVSPDGLISTSEATNNSVDEIAETSEVANDEGNVASTIEEEVVASDPKNDNGSTSETVNDTKGEDLQLPAPETVGLQSTEVASDREELVSKAFYLESGFASLQSPIKELAGREDAYFISHHNWLGVADGVSQWSFEGINKGMYAQELMSNCQKIISDETAEISDPVQVLQRSVNEAKSSGSSTALIAHLDNNELHIANIGDSGFIVIRNRTVLQKSSPMFHHFCFPLQITRGEDVLKLAEVYHVNLEEGDVVITATDGLFDNLYEEEIVSIVCSSLEQSLELQEIAEVVAAKAQEVGRSETERTPFADAAKEEGYDGYRGGKLDAVTVIVSLVKAVSA